MPPPCSLEDDGAVAIEQHAVFAVPLDGARQHLAFGIAAKRCQVFDRAAVVNARHVLLDDRAFVQIGRYVVRGAPISFTPRSCAW